MINDEEFIQALINVARAKGNKMSERNLFNALKAGLETYQKLLEDLALNRLADERLKNDEFIEVSLNEL